VGEIFSLPRASEPLPFSGERFTTAAGGQIEIEHLHRYFVARELCRGKRVLDIASGEGYGTALLAQTASYAVGIEIDPGSAAHARGAYRRNNLSFAVGDARYIPLATESFDVVVSFETLEHIYEQQTFLSEVKRVLKPGGVFIVSTPDRDVYSPAGVAANPFHVRELTRDEFMDLMHGTFQHVLLLKQRPLLGSAMMQDGSRKEGAELTFERRDEARIELSRGLARAMYLIAIASDDATHTNIPGSIYIQTSAVDEPIFERDRARAERDALRAERDSALAETQRVGAYMQSRIQQAEEARNAMLAANQALQNELAAIKNELECRKNELAVGHNDERESQNSQRIEQLEKEVHVVKEHESMRMRAYEELSTRVGHVEQLIMGILQGRIWRTLRVLGAPLKVFSRK
jgi:SAM-dependent methyltransferase